MSDRPFDPVQLRALAEQAKERSRGPLPIDEWGPKCAGCGADEYRIDGYCSVECRDYHDEELAEPFLALLDRLAATEHERNDLADAAAKGVLGVMAAERRCDQLREALQRISSYPVALNTEPFRSRALALKAHEHRTVRALVDVVLTLCEHVDDSGSVALAALAAVGEGAPTETIEEAVAAERLLSDELAAYENRWVAVLDHHVVASADTFDALLTVIGPANNVDGCFQVIPALKGAAIFAAVGEGDTPK